MLVVATAGHVDHGKTTLLRALTGMEPDRLAEERRRGLTIELGFAWTTLADGSDVAFVDVPGHERFLATMLAGIGPVPAVLFVVAADEGWRQQSEEHLLALLALDVRHGVVAVTRADLADPAPATAQIRRRLTGGPLAGAPVVPVSSPTGAGLDRLRAALWRMSTQVPAPDPDADVRMWLDRAFTVRGAGTVVTGTLPAGRVSVGDRLRLLPGGVEVGVRRVQTLRRDVHVATGTARVALNLRGLARPDVARGAVLTAPDRFLDVSEADVRILPVPTSPPVSARSHPPEPPIAATVHVGAAAVPARLRPLWGADRGPGLVLARLRLARPLPLRIGDRVLLRDPGTRGLWGADVLDVEPPPLLRRGQAAARVDDLAGMLDGAGAACGYVRARALVPLEDLARVGLTGSGGGTRTGVTTSTDRSGAAGLVVRAGWVAEPAEWVRLADLAWTAVAAHDAGHPLHPGLPLDELGQALGRPDPAVVRAVADDAGLSLAGGRAHQPGAGPVLDDRQTAAVAALRDRLAERPFDAPTAAELAEAGLGADVLAAAEQAALLWRPAPGLVLLPGADLQAAALLAGLDQPFSVSDAARVLGCSRRVAVPLLEMLDRAGTTSRRPDSRRTVRVPTRPAAPAISPHGRR